VFEFSRWTLLHSLNFRLSTGVRSLKLLFGLLAEIGPVHKEEHTPGSPYLDKAIDLGDASRSCRSLWPSG